MKTILSIVAALAVCFFAVSASAQSSNSFQLGASFTHNGDFPSSVKGIPAALKTGDNIGGVDAQFDAKLAGAFHLALDLNASHNSKESQALFLAGPRVEFGKNTQLYGDALIGGGYTVEKLATFKPTDLADSHFAYGLGVGLKKFVSKHFGLFGEVRYVYTDAFHGSEQNLRATAGAAWRF